MTITVPTDPKFQDLTGLKFGRWIVLEYAGKRGIRHYWLCRCKCGEEKVVDGGSLRSGGTKSCGCFQREQSRGRLIDLIGQEFFWLIVLKYAGKKGKSHYWLCRCKCGTEKVVDGESLRSGNTKSCGCFQRERQRRKMLAYFVGRVFGRYTVLKYAGKRGTHHYFLCRCECGTEKVVQAGHLRSGRTKSCGCYQRERIIETQTTHGLSHTADYRRWEEARRKGKELKLDVNWTRDMEQALYEQQPECVLCGVIHPLSVDHVRPLSRGYGLEPGNAVILCKNCNSQKYNKALEALPAKHRKRIMKAAKAFASYWKAQT